MMDRVSCSTLLIGELSELLDQGLGGTSGHSGPHRKATDIGDMNRSRVD